METAYLIPERSQGASLGSPLGLCGPALSRPPFILNLIFLAFLLSTHKPQFSVHLTPMLTLSRGKPSPLFNLPLVCPGSYRASGSWWVGLQGPFNIYITPHFHKPHALLAPCFRLVSCMAYFSIPKMEATYSCETWGNSQWTIQHYIPEDTTLLCKEHQWFNLLKWIKIAERIFTKHLTVS